MNWNSPLVALIVVVCGALPCAVAQKEYGFDNRKPSGQPYLKPEESLQRLTVPPGWEVKLFAAEPDVINPISFTVDERGRLWVVECFEYPRRTAKGQKPRDRIKILEDTDGDGKADKVTTWAEGKDLPIGWDLASGIEVGHGGAFLGAPPHLFFLQDTTGAGKCDKQEILLSGFGSQDTHETLNTFQWGPDGRLHGLHGIYTQSTVGDIRLNAALWRYALPPRKGEMKGGQFDIFAEGTSNPWGLDFDPQGQAFLCCCVIPHAFHMIQGGTYIRQGGGQGFNPYAYGQLKEICDHQHHKESGWAHAGALVLQGDHIPQEYRGSLLMGSIHGCSVKRDMLERRGSTFVAKHAPDFLVSGDKNFRPINMRWDPDGSIYLIDWHDQNPCHQAAPDAWDYTHGRIYKIQRIGTKNTPPGDLAQKSSKELVELLKNNSPWWHRTALRLLSERRDLSVAGALKDLTLQSTDPAHSLRGLWGLYAIGGLDEAFAEKTLEHANPWVRSWTIRLLGESGQVSDKMLDRLAALARKDPAAEVRLQLASTAGRLTKQNTLPLLHNLMRHKEDARDPCLPLMIWLAFEPRVAPPQGPGAARPGSLGWLEENAPGNALVTDEIVPRTVRRLVATGKPEELASCVVFLGNVKDSAARRRGLEGLLQGLQNRQVDPPPEWQSVLVALQGDHDPEVRRLAERLAVNFRDAGIIRRSLAVAGDRQKPAADRLEAIRDLALAHPPDGRLPLQELVTSEGSVDIRCEACRALAAYDNPEIARDTLAAWTRLPLPVRGEAVLLLSGRKAWAQELLRAMGQKRVARTEVNDNAILRIRAFKDKQLDAQIEKEWGRVRETPAQLQALIDTMRISLHEGKASAEKGRKVFENQCAKCHRFEGKGFDVGPNLDGAARDIEYLLINVLDPNRVIGQPYYMRTVVLKNGRVEAGLLAAEDDQSLTLRGENNILKPFQKKEIDEVQVQEKSIMPEGLNNAMSPQDFRDLVRYVMAHPFLTDLAVARSSTPLAASSLKLDDPIATSGLTWSRPAVGVPGRLVLPAAEGAKDSIAYITADVTAAEAVRTRLQLSGAHAVRAWANGKEVLSARPAKGPSEPDQIGVDVSLRAGVNKLLFEVTYRGKQEVFYARLIDPHRKLTYPER